MNNLAQWIANNLNTVFYLWVKSNKTTCDYQDVKARTVKIVDSITTTAGDFIGVVYCDTCGVIQNHYTEYFALSEVRLGIPDFDYENTHERGDIK